MTSSIKVPLSLRAAALALACGAAPAASIAQSESTLGEIKATASRERDNSKASIGGKADTAVRDLPQTITVLERKMLDAQAATSLKDALRNVPGITLGAGEGGVIGDNINLRGFSARTDVYLDGLRDRGQYARDVFSLEAVEVLKGASSMLFGRGSTGGVINQVSKKPRLADTTEIGASIGTDGYYRATADVNRQLSDTTAARVSVFAQDIHTTRDVEHLKDFGVAPSVSFGLNTPTEVTLAALIQRNHDVPDYGFPLVSSNGSGATRKPVSAASNVFYGYDDDKFKQSVNVFTVALQHKLSAETTLRNRTLFSDNQTDASPSPLGTVVRAGGGTPSFNDPLSILSAPRQDRDRVLKDQSFINQTDLIIKIKEGERAHKVTLGLELGRERSNEDRYVWNTSAGAASVNLASPVNGLRTGDRALSRTVKTQADTLAVYANDELTLTPQWKLVGGLRGERFKASSALQKFALPSGFTADTTVAAAPKSETLWSPRAGALYQPNALQTWYLSYGTSFNPSAETVSQSASTAQLDAEKNKSYEVGLKQELMDGDLTLNGALFRTDKTNARVRDGAGSLQVNAGLIRVQGVELAATGRINTAWDVFAGYTYLDGHIVSSPEIGTSLDAGVAAQGKRAPNTARHNLTVWATVRPAAMLEWGGGLLASSARTLNNFGSAEVGGFVRFDATLAYVQKAYEVRLNLQNLTDRLYFESASGGRATPVRGRTALASVTYRF
ncbi:MAG: TonB-dependent siderophore receptor [Aquabacterium sp.]|nr:TonB-dependent siderophore receptor [Aquabacterium sp.]